MATRKPPAEPKHTKQFTLRPYDDASAAQEARALLARGRKVRFVVELIGDKVLKLRAVDADPFAQAWKEYGQRLWWQQHPYMKHVVVGAFAPMLLMWMLGKEKR